MAVVADGERGATLEVELLYVALRPEIVDAIETSATPAGARFVDLATARPVTPVLIGRTMSNPI